MFNNNTRMTITFVFCTHGVHNTHHHLELKTDPRQNCSKKLRLFLNSSYRKTELFHDTFKSLNWDFHSL